MTRQIGGNLYWFKLTHPNGEYNKLFIEAEKDREQLHGPAIFISVNNLQVIEVRLVQNLNNTISKEVVSLNDENRYFYKYANTLKPQSYSYVLQSELTLLKHV